MKGLWYLLQRACSPPEDIDKYNVTRSMSPELLLRQGKWWTYFLSQDALDVTPTAQNMTTCNFVNICSWLCILVYHWSCWCITFMSNVWLLHILPCLPTVISAGFKARRRHELYYLPVKARSSWLEVETSWLAQRMTSHIVTALIDSFDFLGWWHVG